MQPILEVDDVSKSYSGIDALRGMTFSIAAGEIVGLVGPNGAGKSTTVKIVTGMIEPSTGSVSFCGRRIGSDLLGYRAALGYVPEEAHVYTHLSGLEYLQLVGRLREIPEEILDRRARQLLAQFGLEVAQYSAMSLYSKGMKQRVLMAAAILHNPALIVLDEPLSGLDVTTARLFRDLMVELAAAGKAILYISHVLEVVERVCDRVLVLAGGAVRAAGPPAAMCRELGVADLSEAFALVARQRDTRQTARAMVEALHAA